MCRRVWNGRYNICSRNENFAIVDCSYDCPYCGQDTGSILTIYSDAFDLLDSGGFGEQLTCTYCDETAEVLFG